MQILIEFWRAEGVCSADVRPVLSRTDTGDVNRIDTDSVFTRWWSRIRVHRAEGRCAVDKARISSNKNQQLLHSPPDY